jgi:hypothetical protein
LKTYRGVDVQNHVFLILALIGGVRKCVVSLKSPGKEVPVTNGHMDRRGWVGPRTSLDVEKKRKFLALPGL